MRWFFIQTSESHATSSMHGSGWDTLSPQGLWISILHISSCRRAGAAALCVAWGRVSSTQGLSAGFSSCRRHNPGEQASLLFSQLQLLSLFLLCWRLFGTEASPMEIGYSCSFALVRELSAVKRGTSSLLDPFFAVLPLQMPRCASFSMGQLQMPRCTDCYVGQSSLTFVAICFPSLESYNQWNRRIMEP